MKIIKAILLTILITIAAALITALFVKKEIGTEKEVLINRPKDQVFAYIKLLKNQDQYSKWASMDPAMVHSYRGTDGTVGFVSAWESKKDDVGSGEQEITKITEGERIDYALRFLEPFESQAETWFTTAATDSAHTLVKWGFKGKMNYPLNLMRLFMDMDESIGKDFETGLSNLKALLEKQ